MPEPTQELFNPRTVVRLSSTVKPTLRQRHYAREWITLLESEALVREKKNYLKFALIVLQNILGYSISEDLQFEEGNVEFSFRKPSGEGGICFEAKGSKMEDLFANQNREKPEHRTPVTQTWDNMGRNNFDYGVATNYRDYVLIDKSKGYSRYHFFDFMSIKGNESKLREFIAIFSKESILDRSFIPKLLYESSIEERVFTNEFYKLFHETRLMLVRELKENGKLDSASSLHFAQLFLNRLIFMFFAQGTGKLKRRLFADSILESLNPAIVSEYSRYASDTILNLFERLDRGSSSPIEIFGFNGGLFRERIPLTVYFNDMRKESYFKDIFLHSELKNDVKLDEASQAVIYRFRSGLNPIISNLLLLSSFDFQSEVNVRILGHIFEQSLTDLEELENTERVSKRKKEGIYYTPDYVTDYICRSTIIPYLSKKGVTTVSELIEEYADDMEELELRFKAIKVVDPACGSGAFLIRAVDVLLEIHKGIREFKDTAGGYTSIAKGRTKESAGARFTSLKKWVEEEEVRTIVENNIFGVDVNDESVEITKLSLFLKIASTNRKLVDLSKNIRLGNSIISDQEIAAGKGFDWAKEFKEIGGRFDVVIGNPPYIPLENMTDAEADYYGKHYEGIFRKYDTSVVFAEKALDLVKHNGFIGFIMPLTWQTGDNYLTFRKMFFAEKKVSLQRLVNLPFDVFPDAYVDTGIAVFRNGIDIQFFEAREYAKDEKISAIEDVQFEKISLQRILEESDLKVFANDSTYEILKKVGKDSIQLGPPLTDSCQGIVTSQYPISEKKESEYYRPFLLDADANRYRFFVRSSAFIDFRRSDTILHLYTQPKIMVRRIVNRQNRLMAFYEDSGIITNKDYNPFVIQPQYRGKFDVFYLLALLNSKLFSFLYIKKSSIALKDDFRQTTLAEIRKLPVKSIAIVEQAKFADKARELSRLHGKYYELKEKVVRRIQENFNLRNSRRFEEITELSFPAFKKEIEKVTGRKMKLEEQDEWEKYLGDNQNQLRSLKNEIVEVENELDEAVYNLYRIDSKERKLVEESLREKEF